MKRLHQFVIAAAVLCPLLLPNDIFAQKCPNKLLYTFANYYYYNVKDCATGQIGSEVFVYSSIVQTGCNGANGCDNRNTLHRFVRTALVGDPPGGRKDGEPKVFKKVVPDSGIMVEFGQSPISLYGGYPKFVQADVDGQTRFFKLYHVSYNDERGQNRSVRMGAEITEIPAGKQSVTAASVDYARNRIEITIPSQYGGSEKFDVLHELVKQE
ncbi:MAG: hypothetical protein R3C03_18010 [Pirellulaceae bacterium]